MAERPTCACGCGERVTLAHQTYGSLKKGEPRRFVSGHNRRVAARDPVERFWEKVERGANDECWPWTGGSMAEGYGKFYLSSRKMALAHRFAYELLVGSIPEGLTLDHLCRNPSCVNPAHLEPVTDQVNILRGTGPTAANARKTHCKHGHPLEGDNLILRPNGRRCRACRDRDNARRFEASHA